MRSASMVSPLRELRSVLERERMRLLQNLGRLVDAERSLSESQAEESSAGGGMADVATDMAEQTLDASFERMERERYRDVEAALHRIDEGTYGTCERCGTAVNVARLVAVPWTRYCIACSQRLRGGRHRHDA
jgi:DnaK suppressor protein